MKNQGRCQWMMLIFGRGRQERRGCFVPTLLRFERQSKPIASFNPQRSLFRNLFQQGLGLIVLTLLVESLGPTESSVIEELAVAISRLECGKQPGSLVVVLGRILQAGETVLGLVGPGAAGLCRQGRIACAPAASVLPCSSDARASP